MSTSEIRRRDLSAGFTLVELLVGLALSVSMAMTVAPLWLSLEGAGTRAADRTVWVIQERVAVARFERDVRLAGAEDCVFPIAAPVLAASGSQVVFLGRSCAESPITIVEWEIARGSLMRRWGTCPEERPASFPHSLYLDHKTMLEDVGKGSTFSYLADGREVVCPVAEGELASIDAVVLRLQTGRVVEASEVAVDRAALTTVARVGR